MKRPLYKHIATRLQAIENCRKTGNHEWFDKHGIVLNKLCAALPSGSGIDCGTSLADSSTGDRLIFDTSYHHMDEYGGYDGWTSHRITVTASLANDIEIKIAGRNRNDIKDYLHEVFYETLKQEIDDAEISID